MTKCINCGREVGNTAGPCVQCTILMKKGKVPVKQKCPSCNISDFSNTDTHLVLCNLCGRLY